MRTVGASSDGGDEGSDNGEELHCDGWLLGG